MGGRQAMYRCFKTKQGKFHPSGISERFCDLNLTLQGVLEDAIAVFQEFNDHLKEEGAEFD